VFPVAPPPRCAGLAVRAAGPEAHCGSRLAPCFCSSVAARAGAGFSDLIKGSTITRVALRGAAEPGARARGHNAREQAGDTSRKPAAIGQGW